MVSNVDTRSTTFLLSNRMDVYLDMRNIIQNFVKIGSITVKSGSRLNLVSVILYLKGVIMEGVSIIEGQTLKYWEQKLTNIEQNQLAIIKFIQQISPYQIITSSVPDFICIENAAKKYNTTKATIYNKIKLFENAKGRKIDRLQKGAFNLVNEVELLEAMRIKGTVPIAFSNKNKK